MITVGHYFNGDGAAGFALDAIEFADGTSWDLNSVNNLILRGSVANSAISGASNHKVLSDSNAVEQVSNSGVLLDSQLNQLVSAMASYGVKLGAYITTHREQEGDLVRITLSIPEQAG
ncbi:MAG: hypothetical protein CR978_00350 [Gammaproteobacteria bacterium]|nr:MAG: hypothetical protein CR978_00350 [Gammaproteobacteria bacterium]